LFANLYKLTEKFPKSEMFGLTSQMRRAAVSIPSNIAEGRRRGSRKDFRNFITMAYGSGAELETQIEICKQINLAKKPDYVLVDKLLDLYMNLFSLSFLYKLQTKS